MVLPQGHKLNRADGIILEKIASVIRNAPRFLRNHAWYERISSERIKGMSRESEEVVGNVPNSNDELRGCKL